MKKALLSIWMIAMALCFAACNHNEPKPDDDPNNNNDPKEPAVEVTFTSVNPTSITAKFEPNEACVKYVFIIDEPGSSENLAYWAQMFGFTLEQMVEELGVETVGDTTFTFKDLPPKTEHILYTMAYDAEGNKVFHGDTIYTETQGGSGQSVITVTVTNITSTSAYVTATPNDQTCYFYDGLIVRSYADSIGTDSMAIVLKEQPYVMYKTDEWEWQELLPGTEYYACGIGANANDEWGPLEMVLFSTTSEASTMARSRQLKANVRGGMLELNGMPEDGAIVTLYNGNGVPVMRQRVVETHAAISVRNLAHGTYTLRVMGGRSLAHKKIQL
ncbi:MAG: hypothetical protein MJZ98_03170 [Paludibacteraceae bacterium]|nr:hypothetical protein [Paludibacteraceae bacterium]